MPPEYTLRPGREADLRAMYLLDLVCFDEPFRFSLPAMRRFVLRPGAIVIVAEQESRLAGFVVVHLVRDKAYVVTLDVAAEFRRHGLATALLQSAEAAAKIAGATGMVLHVSTANRPAIAFYQRRAYLRDRQCPDFYAVGLHADRYRKPF